MKLADIFLSLGADDSGLGKDLKAAENKTLGWVGGLAKATAVAVGSAVLVAGGLAVNGLTKYVDYNKAISEVFTLLPNLSKEATDKLSADARAWSAELGVLTDQSIPALYQAISAGVPPENVFDWLTVAQKAAIGGVTELETSVDGISSVVNAYGQEVISATEASDLMFTAVKLGKTDFGQLSQSLFNVIPTAASLKVKFGDITAGLAAMTAQGTPTSVATTQLRQLLVELSKDGSKAAAEFERISGKSFPDFIAEGGNLADALQAIEDDAKKSNKSVSNLFSSVEAGNAALALTGSGAETYRKNLAEMAASAGATDKAFETMEKTSARAIERLKAKMEKSQLDLGEKLEPGLAAGLRALESFADSPAVSRFTDKILNGIEAIGERAGNLVDIFAETGSVFSSEFLEALTAGLPQESQDKIFGFAKRLEGGFDLLKNWWTANGPGLQEAAQTVLGGLQNLLGGLADRFGPFIEQTFAKVMNWLVENGPLIQDTANAIATFFSEIVIPTLLAAVDIIMPILSGLIDILLDLGKLVMQVITGDWQGAWQTAQNILQTAGSAILEAVTRLLNFILSWFGTSLEKIGATWKHNWEMFLQIVALLTGRIISKAIEIVNGIREKFKIDWGAIGRNIIDGIAKGITNGIGAIKEAARNAAKAALDAAKDWLQSKSPSRRAADEVGEPISDGTALGVERRMPHLKRTLQDSLKDALGSVSDMSVPVGFEDVPSIKGLAGGVNVTIYQNMPLTLSDEYTLERLLEPIFMRLKRKAEAA